MLEQLEPQPCPACDGIDIMRCHVCEGTGVAAVIVARWTGDGKRRDLRTLSQSSFPQRGRYTVPDRRTVREPWS